MRYCISFVLSNAPCFKDREWSIEGDDLTKLIIYDNKGDISLEDIEKAGIELQQLIDSTEYLCKREKEMPKINDLIDMLWQSMDSGEIQKDSRFYQAIKAVYDKYPKPS